MFARSEWWRMGGVGELALLYDFRRIRLNWTSNRVLLISFNFFAIEPQIRQIHQNRRIRL